MWSANVRLWGKQRHWRLILHRSRESCTTSPGNGVETNSWPKVHRAQLNKSHLSFTSPTVFLTTSLDVGQEARARESVEKHWNANKTLEQRKSDNCRRKALKKRIMLDRVENANANVANGENANANAWKGWECKCKCEDKDLSSLLLNRSILSSLADKVVKVRTALTTLTSSKYYLVDVSTVNLDYLVDVATVYLDDVLRPRGQLDALVTGVTIHCCILQKQPATIAFK